MNTIPKEASEAAEYAVANFIGKNKSPSVKAISDTAILAALPHLGEPAAWQRRSGVFSWVFVDPEDIKHCRSMGQEVRPLFLAPPAPAVAIKPLQWRGPECGFYEADVLGRVVSIMDSLFNEPGRFVLHPSTNDRRKFDTLEAAKAAAQADYEAHIRSVLVDAPAASVPEIPNSPPAVDPLMEHMADALEALIFVCDDQWEGKFPEGQVDAARATLDAYKARKGTAR